MVLCCLKTIHTKRIKIFNDRHAHPIHLYCIKYRTWFSGINIVSCCWCIHAYSSCNFDEASLRVTTFFIIHLNVTIAKKMRRFLTNISVQNPLDDGFLCLARIKNQCKGSRCVSCMLLMWLIRDRVLLFMHLWSDERSLGSILEWAVSTSFFPSVQFRFHRRSLRTWQTHKLNRLETKTWLRNDDTSVALLFRGLTRQIYCHILIRFHRKYLFVSEWCLISYAINQQEMQQLDEV